MGVRERKRVGGGREERGMQSHGVKAVKSSFTDTRTQLEPLLRPNDQTRSERDHSNKVSQIPFVVWDLDTNAHHCFISLPSLIANLINVPLSTTNLMGGQGPAITKRERERERELENFILQGL